jgi:sec-independent protein translocase protein TatA
VEAAPANSILDVLLILNWRRFMLEGLLQPTHLLVIFGIALLVFGPRKLPELGKGIGESIRGFKLAMKGHVDSSDNGTGDQDSIPR